MTTNCALERVIGEAGSRRALAIELGVVEQAIGKWICQGWAPLERAVEMEILYGVPREELVEPLLRQFVATNERMNPIDWFDDLTRPAPPRPQPREPGIAAAVRYAGSQENLGRMLSVCQQAISLWISRGWVPKRQAKRISAMFGMPSAGLLNPKIADRLNLRIR